MADMTGKEVQELDEVNLTDESLILTYTENDGVGYTFFSKIKAIFTPIVNSIVSVVDDKVDANTSLINTNTDNIKSNKDEIDALSDALDDEIERATNVEGGIATNASGIATNATAITALQTSKQDKLTAGSNISISDSNEISCDVTTMNFKGAVDTFDELPTENLDIGDVWNITSTNDTYCWNGTDWVGIGTSVDLSGYVSSNVDNSKLWKGTKAEYDAIETKDPNTTYVITDEDSEHSFVVDTNALSPSVFMRDVGTICDTDADVADKEVVINQFALVRGAVLKVLFTNANTAENPTISVKSSDGYVYADKIAIKAVRGGEKIVPVVHSGKWRGADAYTDEMWQPYTTIEVMYDGYDFVIMGNPLFESYVSEDGTSSYSVYADGYIEQRYIRTSSSGGADIYFLVNFKISNYSFETSMAYSNSPESMGIKNNNTTSFARIAMNGSASGNALCLVVSGY